MSAPVIGCNLMFFSSPHPSSGKSCLQESSSWISRLNRAFRPDPHSPGLCLCWENHSLFSLHPLSLSADGKEEEMRNNLSGGPFLGGVVGGLCLAVSCAEGPCLCVCVWCVCVCAHHISCWVAVLQSSNEPLEGTHIRVCVCVRECVFISVCIC